MTRPCGSCMCSSPIREGAEGRLVLATAVDHTATALRSLGLRRGTPLRVLEPGLLELCGPDLGAFLADARDGLSSVEAEEVHCVVVAAGISDRAMLARALTAPTLATAGARVQHADLLPLFDDEDSCFTCVYQPIVDLTTGRTVAHEALLRATTPEGRLLLPEALFTAAARSGWTHVLDRIGRTTALHQAGPWLGDDLLFINFVPTSIYRPEICLRTTELAAEEAGLSLSQLVFEVTESHRVQDLDHLERVFAYYRERGCRVALDDLGSGWSSLNMLVRLQPDVVKLDKEIVQGLPDRVAATVVEAVVSITRSYGGKVLAECVETAEQADAAAALGVDLAQGWWYGRPVPPQLSAVARPRRGPRAVPHLPDPAVGLGAQPLAEEGVGEQARREPVLDELLTRAVASTTSGVVVVDALAPDQPVVHVNPAFERMSGWSAAETLGRNARFLQVEQTDVAVVRALGEAVRAGQEHTCVLLNARKDGSTWWNELHLSPVHDTGGRLTHYLGFQYDVTARVAAERALQHASSHDGLTGLANRATMLARLDAEVARATASGRAAAVLFLDLDGFKQVNDVHGHLAGDRVLVQVAERLRAGLRSGDLLARQGGDEFVAVLGDLDSWDAERIAGRAADDLLATLVRPVPVPDGVVQLAGSIGLALLPAHGATAESLLAHADAAMYRSKARRARPSGVGAAAEGRDRPVPPLGVRR